MLQKVLFSCIYSGEERHVTCKRFENAASRAKTTSSWRHEITFAFVNVTDDDVISVTAPECLYVKPQSRVFALLKEILRISLIETESNPNRVKNPRETSIFQR